MLIVSARVQVYLKPYKLERNNEVEIIAIISGVVIILSSLVYSEEDKVNVLNSAVLIVTILINLVFLLKWVYMLCHHYEDKNKAAKIVRIFAGLGLLDSVYYGFSLNDM